MGIKFFKKNKLDISNPLPVITITDSVATDTGEAFTNLMRNRDNNSGWMTTGSADAGNTTLEIDFIDSINFDSIILIGHNLKAFTLKYWNGSSWVDFSTPVAETTNTKSTSYFSFNLVTSQKIQLIVTGTQVADAEKVIKQFIVSEILGTFNEEPEVIPTIDRDRKVTKFLSGKSFISKTAGAFNCVIKKKVVADASDLTLAETLFDSYEGFLVWICGGDETQFEQVRRGYRLEDIFLMSCANEYTPEFTDSRWAQGMELNLKLVEVN